MALSDFNIKVTIGAETSQFENSVKRVQTQTAKLSSGFSKLTQGLVKTFIKGGVIMTGIHLATKALKGMYDTVKKGIKLNEEAKQKQNLLAQTLKVTGAEAWTTVEALNEMANSLQEVTNYSGEEITDMQTLLLGFKNITGDNFKEAQNAILDMATEMKMDLTSATQTVAKALDDPVKGLGSLQRQGFAFSKTQQTMLKDMVAVGDIAKAQKIILDELNTTYGGAAKAGAKPLTQLKNNWEDLVKEMGRNIALNIDIKPATEKINKLVQTWKDALDEMADIKEKSDKLFEAQEAVQKGTATDEQSLLVKQREIELIQQQIDLYQEMYDNAESFEDKQYALNHLKSLGLEIGQLKSQTRVLQQNIDKRKEEEKVAEKKRKALQDEQDKLTALNDLIARYNKKIKTQEKEWESTEEVTGEVVDKTDKLKFYEEQLVKAMVEAKGEIKQGNDFYDKQMEIILNLKKEIQTETEWEKKLREQMIASLEEEKKEKLAGVENEKHANILKEKLTVEYNELIKQLRLEALAEEEREALKSVKDLAKSEEEKTRIKKYYENERTKLIVSYAEENKKAGANEVEDFVDRLKKQFPQLASIITKVNNEVSKIKEGMDKVAKAFNKAEEVIKKIGKVFSSVGKVLSNIGNIAKSMFQGGVSIFSKLFDIDIDTVLDTILKIEDKVLTFFVETLPRLPSYVSSVLQSIAVLFQNLAQTVDFEVLSSLIQDMVSMVVSNAPSIIADLMTVGTNIILGLVDGFTKTMPDIFKALSEIKDSIMESLTNIIPEIIPFVGELLKNGIPVLVDTIFDIVDIVFENLPTIVKELVETLPVLVQAIVDNLPKFFEESLPALINGIVDLIPTIFSSTGQLIKGIVEATPLIITAIIKGLVDMLSNLNAEKIAEIITAIIKMVGDIAAGIINSIGLIITKLLPAMVELVIELIKKLPEILVGVFKGTVEGIGQLATAVWDGVKSAGKAIGGFFKNLFTGKLFASGTENAPRGLAIVGEKGPELVNFRGGEQVFSNGNTQRALAGMGNGGNDFTVNFYNTKDTTAYTVMRELKQYNRQMAINGII